MNNLGGPLVQHMQICPPDLRGQLIKAYSMCGPAFISDKRVQSLLKILVAYDVEFKSIDTQGINCGKELER